MSNAAEASLRAEAVPNNTKSSTVGGMCTFIFSYNPLLTLEDD